MSKPTPSRVRVDGPLKPYADGFRRELARQGYSASPAAGHLQLMAHLSRWLEQQDLEPGELAQGRVEQFVEHRRAAGRVHRQLTLKGRMGPLLGYLRAEGVVPAFEPHPVTDPLELLLAEFVGYLVHERGLAAPTVANHRRVAKTFLSARSGEPGSNEGVVDALMTAEEVIGFVLGEAERCSPGSLNNVATGLRALLRFLYVCGYTTRSLAAAVPTAPGWRDSGIPRAASPQQVARLLESCDRRSATGRRDFAIVMLLARLGLRAGEAAALEVDDIDWRAGEVMVTGKGNRREQLPLPHDVGEAIAGYCRRGRRRGDCRDLFLRVSAPHTGLSTSGISEVVARACTRAGLPRLGAHRLRHAAATEMRRAGAPLFEIGQALRHRHVASTAHYARDDYDALTAVAHPWPGGVA
jgi:integrase/recombinase XerD